MKKLGISNPLMVKSALTALGVTLLAGALLGGCAKKEEKKADANSAPKVSYVLATLKPVTMAIDGAGSVEAWQDVPVGSEVGGMTVVALLADEGQYVKQGQVLLRMNDTLLSAQWRQAKAQAEQAQKAYERAQEVYQKGFLSKAALDNAEANFKTASAALDTAQTQLNLATVRAPISGIVTKRTAVMGQIVQPGAELFRIVRDGALDFNMELTEDELPKVKAGQAVEVVSDSVAPTTGRVRLVTPSLDARTRVGYARVSVSWNSGLRPGMFAKGRIDGATLDAVVVPSRSVVYIENKPGVFVVGIDNHVRFVPVTVGQAVGNDVVVSAGLEPDSQVITKGAGFLVDGDTVQATPEGAQTAAPATSSQTAQ